MLSLLSLSFCSLTDDMYSQTSHCAVSNKDNNNFFIHKNNVLASALLIFAVEVQVFHCVQIPLQFHCIFYRQPMQILNVKTAKKYLQWVVCKKMQRNCSGICTTVKTCSFCMKILAVQERPISNHLSARACRMRIKFSVTIWLCIVANTIHGMEVTYLASSKLFSCHCFLFSKLKVFLQFCKVLVGEVLGDKNYKIFVIVTFKVK